MKPRYRVVRDGRNDHMLPANFPEFESLDAFLSSGLAPSFACDGKTIAKDGPWGVLDQQDTYINPLPFLDKRDATGFARARRREENDRERHT